MKTLNRWFVCCLLTVGSAVAESVNVSASQAIRIAVIDTHVRDQRQDGASTLHRAFAPLFERSVAGLAGGEAPIDLVRVSADAAADGLKRGVYDAILVFQPRLPIPIKRAKYHALRATPLLEREDTAVYLVLRREQPDLDALLANAFSAAVNHERVRQALVQTTVVAANR